jgi:transcriptional regulator GlxA family with amidase domain
MRPDLADISQSEDTFISTGDDSAVNVVSRVRRRLFLGADGRPRVRPTAPITRSVRLVEARFDQQITLEDMAAAAGISKFHFAREFKARTGLSPVAFLRGYRVVSAMERLVSSTEPISEVGAAAGYQNAAAFSRAFHKFTGSTPYLFRMTHPARADEKSLHSA